MTLAELVADVAWQHRPKPPVHERSPNWCIEDTMEWPCDAARLAALLTPESVAAGLDAISGAEFGEYWDRRGDGLVLLTNHGLAAALLGSITEADR